MTSLIYPSLLLDEDTAIKYGMPNIGCHYTRDDVAATAPDDDWVACAVCGKTARQCHHEPPRSASRTHDPKTGRKMNGALLLQTPRGQFVLKPALMALCKECHDKRHALQIEIAWQFDTEEYRSQWLDGYLLSRPHIKAHGQNLYGYGCWHFHDKTTDRRWEHRGGGY